MLIRVPPHRLANIFLRSCAIFRVVPVDSFSTGAAIGSSCNGQIILTHDEHTEVRGPQVLGG